MSCKNTYDSSEIKKKYIFHKIKRILADVRVIFFVTVLYTYGVQLRMQSSDNNSGIRYEFRVKALLLLPRASD